MPGKKLFDYDDYDEEKIQPFRIIKMTVSIMLQNFNMTLAISFAIGF